MKRLLFAVVACLLVAAPLFADVTTTMTMTMNAGPMNMSGTVISFLKNGKFRSDATIANQDASVLMDPATKQQWMINHQAKTIEPVSGASPAMAGLPMTFGEAKVSVTPTGQTKEILGHTCQGFNIEMNVPITISGETVTMKMTGPAWIAKEGAGVAEYRTTQKALAELGMSMSPLAQGPSAKGLAEMGKALVDAGLPMEQEFLITLEGTGQVAQAMAQMKSSVSMKITALSTDSIPDTKFALPEGYTKK